MSTNADSVFWTRTMGLDPAAAAAAAAGNDDQYADGKAAKVWELYVGSKEERTVAYRNFVVNYLRDHGCEHILDAACGTGVDSIMLIQEGFDVVSTDASDKMLKWALRKRWDHRKTPGFARWTIEEANWMTLQEDLEELGIYRDGGFDAVICIGNSFPHLLDETPNQEVQRCALAELKRVVKPGGLLMIDHRNYDRILETGHTPPGKNIYYTSQHMKDMRCFNLYMNGRPLMTTIDYAVDVTAVMTDTELQLLPSSVSAEEREELCTTRFRLSYYPHRMEAFTRMLRETFGAGAKHEVYGDFQPISAEYTPAYYIHVIKKLTAEEEAASAKEA